MISWTVLSFLASSFAPFSKASSVPSKSPFRDFHFLPECVFIFFPLHFLGEKAPLHHSVRAVSVIAAFNVLQVLSGWRFQLPLTLYSCLPFFLGTLSKPFHSCSFLAKMFTTFLARNVLFASFFQSLPRCACFSVQIHATGTLSMVRLLSPSETRCNISGINWLCMIPHPP